MEQTPVLEIREVSKRFGLRQVLDHISLSIPSGEIFGFLGPNGAGKTTTIKLVLGLLKIDSGDILIQGHSVRTDFEQAMYSVGGIVENPELYRYLSGRQNLLQFARVYPSLEPGRIEEVIAMVGLQDRIDDKVKNYSLGMRQRLGIAQALLHKPSLLVLDEPANGLDPAGIKLLRDILKRQAHEEGLTVFVSSHLLSELELFCDRFGIIDRGGIAGIQSMQQLRSHQACQDVIFTVSDPQKAADAACAVDHGCRPQLSRDTMRLTTASENIPQMIRQISETDVRVYAVVPVQKSLEQAYLEAMAPSARQSGAEGGTAQ